MMQSIACQDALLAQRNGGFKRSNGVGSEVRAIKIHYVPVGLEKLTGGANTSTACKNGAISKEAAISRQEAGRAPNTGGGKDSNIRPSPSKGTSKGDKASLKENLLVIRPYQLATTGMPHQKIRQDSYMQRVETPKSIHLTTPKLRAHFDSECPARRFIR
ncbi:hypothetical protein M408DRAFT_12544 [Serendipita vermifera MAFF 305830]|uniref:Uncharacterized protein n=1 Tax=Serendipita vermifera MAFF 305830 TaxID=933852 RepID=A0A0C3AQC0_SERVB|nr:hypothetical protein M408DRAFT_12544 [Serendipita vermifera MAFF 305830]